MRHARVVSLAHRFDSFVVYFLEGLQHVSFPGIQEKSNFNLDPALEDEFLGDIKPSVHSNITGDYILPELFAQRLVPIIHTSLLCGKAHDCLPSREETGNESAASTQFSRVLKSEKKTTWIYTLVTITWNVIST